MCDIIQIYNNLLNTRKLDAAICENSLRALRRIFYYEKKDKRKYLSPETEIVRFNVDDIITTSDKPTDSSDEDYSQEPAFVSTPGNYDYF